MEQHDAGLVDAAKLKIGLLYSVDAILYCENQSCFHWYPKQLAVITTSMHSWFLLIDTFLKVTISHLEEFRKFRKLSSVNSLMVRICTSRVFEVVEEPKWECHSTERINQTVLNSTLCNFPEGRDLLLVLRRCEQDEAEEICWTR